MKNAKTLLVTTYDYPGRKVVTEVYYNYLLNNGYDVTLCASNKKASGDPNVVSPSIKSNNIYVREILFNIFLLKFVLLNRKKITHIFVISPLFLGAGTLMVARFLKIRVIYDIRTGPVTVKYRGLKYRLIVMLERLNLLVANHVVVIELKLLEVVFGKVFIKKAVELTDGHYDYCMKLERKSDDKVKFVLPTSLHKTRKINLIIEAFKGMSHLHLFIFGDGTNLSKLKRDYGGLENVHFMGYVRHCELLQKYTEFDYGISFIPMEPYYEYQPPLKTIEFLGAGLPVIATNTFGNRKYVKKCNGILIKDNVDALRGILADIGKYEFDYLTVKESVKQYEWNFMLSRAFEILFS